MLPVNLFVVEGDEYAEWQRLKDSLHVLEDGSLDPENIPVPTEALLAAAGPTGREQARARARLHLALQPLYSRIRDASDDEVDEYMRLDTRTRVAPLGPFVKALHRER